MGALTRRRALVTSVCVVAALAAGASAWAIVDPAARSSASDQSQVEHRPTVPVTRGDLVDSKVFAGTLGYGAPTTVPGAAAGTVTWLPAPGQVVHRDELLYAVDERGVRAMHGAVPLWRSLERGLEGSDVLQLNQNLAALGYDVSVDDTFGPRTQRAVERWQEDRGHEVTGTITSADIAFVDGDVRVATVDGTLGQPASVDLLTVTSTNRTVTATVSQRDADRLAVGTEVRVRINGGGDELDGTVVDVVPSSAENAGSKVDVSVAFEAGDHELPAAASAQVEASGESVQDVLSVPVAALVANGDGEYAVEVVRRDGSSTRVPVRPGFVAGGRIAITGKVAAGDHVVVPG